MVVTEVFTAFVVLIQGADSAMGLRMQGPGGQGLQGPQGGAPGNLMVRGMLGSMQRAMNPQMQGQGQDMQQQMKQFEVSTP